MTLIDELSAILGNAFQAVGLAPDLGAVKVADRPDLAQFQCNGALAAAKQRKQNPRNLAEEIIAALPSDAPFRETSIAGPGFINLILDNAWLAEKLTGEKSPRHPFTQETPETIILDYGGPNVAKPLHVGHLRSAIIGESIKRLFRHAGARVISDVHLGDWGLQMGQLISELALREPDLIYFDATIEEGYPDEPPISLRDLEEMYPKASADCKADEARANLARKATKDLQDGRPGYRALWRHFITLSVAAMKVDYADLGVSFDWWKGEADADAFIPEIKADLEARGIIENSDGAKIIRVARDDDKKEMPPIIFENSKGAVGYHATDIATVVDRKRSENPTRILYVVDARQRLHFEQVFRAVDRAGYFEEAALEHLWFGTMNGKDGKPFKTREGTLLKLRDMIALVTQSAEKRLVENGLAQDVNEAQRSDIARNIGVAALKFGDLSNPRVSDYIFDLDRFTSFEGKTGPYLLYARVRLRSILDKIDAKDQAVPSGLKLDDESEIALALTLLRFADAHRSAVEKRAPHILCDHAFALAQAFSKFYANCPILSEDDETKRGTRIALAMLTATQLDTVFKMLGINAPEKM